MDGVDSYKAPISAVVLHSHIISNEAAAAFLANTLYHAPPSDSTARALLSRLHGSVARQVEADKAQQASKRRTDSSPSKRKKVAAGESAKDEPAPKKKKRKDKGVKAAV